jgi:hypothetical protein
MSFAKKLKLPVKNWTLEAVDTHFGIDFDCKKLHTSGEDARVLSLAWFKMMELLEVARPDIDLVEDLVAWISTALENSAVDSH